MMNTYYFNEATPLLKFIEENKNRVLGCTLKRFHAEFWPEQGNRSISDRPVVIELADYCIVVNYYIYSDMELVIGAKKELIKNQDVELIVNRRNIVQDYYREESKRGINKDRIENCKIVDIKVERFSKAFECNANGDIRPNGGDYFSTIRFYLDSGAVLCLCGVDSITDGYVELWCE